MKKIFIAISVIMCSMILSGCGFGRVGECRERYIGCHWNCELQYGWTGYHGAQHDELVQKAAAESCYWQERPNYSSKKKSNRKSRSSTQLIPDYCFNGDGDFICDPDEYSDLIRYD